MRERYRERERNIERGGAAQNVSTQLWYNCGFHHVLADRMAWHFISAGACTLLFGLYSISCGAKVSLLNGNFEQKRYVYDK